MSENVRLQITVLSVDQVGWGMQVYIYEKVYYLLLCIFDQESGILFFIVTYVSNTVDYFASECAMSDSNLFDVIIQGIKYNLLERV
jgi:hypothetical protein